MTLKAFNKELARKGLILVKGASGYKFCNLWCPWGSKRTPVSRFKDLNKTEWISLAEQARRELPVIPIG